MNSIEGMNFRELKVPGSEDRVIMGKREEEPDKPETKKPEDSKPENIDKKKEGYRQHFIDLFKEDPVKGLEELEKAADMKRAGDLTMKAVAQELLKIEQEGGIRDEGQYYLYFFYKMDDNFNEGLKTLEKAAKEPHWPSNAKTAAQLLLSRSEVIEKLRREAELKGVNTLEDLDRVREGQEKEVGLKNVDTLGDVGEKQERGDSTVAEYKESFKARLDEDPEETERMLKEIAEKPEATDNAQQAARELLETEDGERDV